MTSLMFGYGVVPAVQKCVCTIGVDFGVLIFKNH